jgi:hypothetical protein
MERQAVLLALALLTQEVVVVGFVLVVRGVEQAVLEAVEMVYLRQAQQAQLTLVAAVEQAVQLVVGLLVQAVQVLSSCLYRLPITAAQRQAHPQLQLAVQIQY